jgi:enoyl-CoA hydratase
MDLLLSGRYISAEEAVKFGLINEVVESDRLLDRAFELAERIAVNSPGAVSATKLSVLEGLKTGTTEAYARELEIGNAIFAAHDATEGPRAFLEKRKPKWQGVSAG